MSLVRKFTLVVCWIFAGLFAIAAAAYVYIFVHTISVNNVSNAQLEDVTVMFGEKKMWQGNLRPGESKWVVGTFDTGGELIIRYKADSRDLIYNAGYSSPGMTPKRQIFHIGAD